MELPADVLIHNEELGMKGKEGRLLAVHNSGYYELVIDFGNTEHRVLMPVAGSVLISAAPEEEWPGVDVEE